MPNKPSGAIPENGTFSSLNGEKVFLCPLIRDNGGRQAPERQRSNLEREQALGMQSLFCVAFWLVDRATLYPSIIHHSAFHGE